MVAVVALKAVVAGEVALQRREDRDAQLVAILARRALSDPRWRDALRYQAILPTAVSTALIEACDA